MGNYNLGIGGAGNYPDDDYEVKYLNGLTEGDQITGVLAINDIKKKEVPQGKNKTTEIDQFYVIVTDHPNKSKWVLGIQASYYEDKGNIYGEKGGRVYDLLDSLSHVLNGTKEKEKDSLSANFEIFKKTVNNDIPGTVTMKAVKPSNPNSKYMNVRIVGKETPAIVNDDTPAEDTEDSAF